MGRGRPPAKPAKTEAEAKRRRDMAERLRPFQWAKGQSGNPAGPKKGQAFAALLRKALDSPDPDAPGLTIGHKIVAEWLGIALGPGLDMASKLRAILSIVERNDGKVPDRVEVAAATARDVIAEMREAAERYESEPGCDGDPGGTGEVQE